MLLRLEPYLRTTCTTTACILAVLLSSGCALIRDYRSQPRAEDKISLALTIEDNQLVLSSATLGGQKGKFVLATAAQVSAVDSAFAERHFGNGNVELVIGERFTATINPVEADLGIAADALLASDLWSDSTISIDYISGLLTLSRDRVRRPVDMAVFPFQGPPSVSLTIDGKTVRAIVDTSLPDTLVLPRGSRSESRTTARVTLGGRTFEGIDVAWSDTSTPRIGNRILSRFLVIINYGEQWVGLWPDPRIGSPGPQPAD